MLSRTMGTVLYCKNECQNTHAHIYGPHPAALFVVMRAHVHVACTALYSIVLLWCCCNIPVVHYGRPGAAIHESAGFSSLRFWRE